MKRERKRLADSGSSGTRPPPKKLHKFTPSPPVEGKQESAPLDKEQATLLKYQNRQLTVRIRQQRAEIDDLTSKIRILEEEVERTSSIYSQTKTRWTMLGEQLRDLQDRSSIGCRSVDEIRSAPSTTKSDASSTGNHADAAEMKSSVPKLTLLSLLLAEGQNSFSSDGNHTTEEEEMKDDAGPAFQFESEDEDENSTLQRLKSRQKIDSSLPSHSSFSTDVLIRLTDLLQRQKETLQSSATSFYNSRLRALSEQSERLDSILQPLQCRYRMLLAEVVRARDARLSESRRTRDVSNDVAQTSAELRHVERLLADLSAQLAAIPSPSPSSSSLSSSLSGSGSSLRTSSTPPTTSSTPSVRASSSGALPKKKRLREEQQQQQQQEEENQRKKQRIARRVEELAEHQSKGTARSEENSRLQDEKIQLLRQLIRLEIEQIDIPDDRVARSSAYQFLQQRAQVAFNQLENQRKLTLNALSAVQNVEREKGRIERDKFIAEEISRRRVLHRDVREIESTLARIRRERDLLAYKLNQRKAFIPSPKVVAEWKTMVGMLESKNRKAKEEGERLRNELARLRERRESAEQNEAVSARVNELNRVLAEYKARETKWEESQREMKMKLECYQSMNKDKREVEAIKKSVSELADELRELSAKEERLQKEKAELAKSLAGTGGGGGRGGGGGGGEEEAAAKNERKEIARGIAKAEQTIREINKAIEIAKNEGQMGIKELDAVAGVFEEMQEQNQRLSTMQSEKEDANTKLLSARIKSEQGQKVLREDKKVLEERIRLKMEESQMSDRQLAETKEALRKVEDMRAADREQIYATMGMVEAMKKQALESAEQMMEARKKQEWHSKILAELRKKNEDGSAELARAETRARRMEEEAEGLARQVEKMTTTTPNQVLEEELVALKKKLQCPVCADRRKDSMITRCAHTFCNACLVKNLTTRHRKCPSCGLSFGDQDLRRIKFDELDIET